MAFNAGAIEATLTLNRNPFTAGLAAARNQARNLARERFEATVTLKVVKREFDEAKRQLRDFAKNSRGATARVNVERVAFDKLVRDLRAFGRQTYTATARINTEGSTRQLDRMLKYLNDMGNAGERSFRGLQRGAQDADRAFDGMSRQVRTVLIALPLLMAVGGSAITGLTGLVGGLTASLAIAGLGVGAFALVAVPAFKKVKDAVGEGQAAIDKLPRGLREAGNALKQLQDNFSKIAAANEGGVGYALAAGFNAANNALSKLQPLIKASTDTFTILGNRMAEYFSGQHFQAFINFVAGQFGPTMTKLFDIIVYLTRAVMNLIIAFQPLGDWILQKAADGMKSFAEWASKIASTPEFQQWIELVKRSLEAMIPFLGSVIEFFFRLSAAVAPVGNVIMTVLTMMFNALNKLPPEWLGAIAMGISAIFTAMLLGAGGPIAVAIGAVVGLATAFATLYDSNERVRGAVNGFMYDLKQTFLPIWTTIVDAFNTKIKPAFNDLVTVVKEKFGPVFESLWTQFKEKVVPALTSIADTLFNRVIPAILQFLKDAAPFVAWFSEVLGSAIIQAFEMIVRVIDGALIIIGGIFKVFSSLFTGDWSKFWEGLKDIGEGLLTIIAGIFGMSLDEMFQMFKDFGNWITTTWTELWAWVGRKWDEFSTWLSDGWNQFWTDIGNLFTDWWTRVTTEWDQLWAAVGLRWNEFETWLTTGWTNFWNDIGRLFTDWWNRVTTEWDQFWTIIGVVFDVAVAYVSTKWTEFWDFMGRKAGEAWDWIVGKFREAKDWMINLINEAADKIGVAWRKVANFFREPINWVIRVVINDGILKGWNTVMGWIGAEGLSVAPLGELPAFAEGGQIVGPGHGTSDSILARVSNGEYIMPAARTAQIGHFLEALRRGQPEAMQAAGGYNDPNPFPRYQAGGLVQAQQFAQAQNGKPYIWGGVGPAGYDCSGFMSAIANSAMGRNPHSRIGTTASAPWPGWSRGLNSAFGVGFFKGNPGHMAGTLGGNNVEAGGSPSRTKYIGSAAGANSGQFTGHMSLPQVGGQFVGGVAGSGSAQAQTVSWWSLLAGRVQSLFNGLLNFGGMPGNGSLIGNAITQVPTKMMGKVISAIRTKLENLFTTIFSSGDGNASVGGADATRAGAQAAVRRVAAGFGWDNGAEWGAIMALVMKESGWNPNAANPTSSARGLFQKMTSIHGPIEGTAEGQAQWGLNYIRGRYGTPSAALRFHNANNYYDRGGLLQPGETYANNETGKPERVLDPHQTDSFERLVQILEALVGPGGALVNGGAGGPAIGNLTVMATPQASAQELIEEAMFQIRKVKRGGRY